MIQRDVEQEIAAVLRELAATLVRSSAQSSMSRVAASTLSVLDRLGEQRVTTLAERELVTQPAMTGLVQRLEASGLVERRPDPDDGRATRIAITDEGRSALQERRRLQDEVISASARSLSRDDVEALRHALPALTHLMERHADISHD